MDAQDYVDEAQRYLEMKDCDALEKEVEDLEAKLKASDIKVLHFMSEVNIRNNTLHEMNEKLKFAVEALEFYSDENNWTNVSSQVCSTMIGDDHYLKKAMDKFCGGRHAMEALEKIKVK